MDIYPGFLGRKETPSPFVSILSGLYGECNWAKDSYVALGRQDMEKVEVPFAKVFEQHAISCMKALFSPYHNQDPTPGFGFGRMSRNYRYTLEGYWVDKHLSTRISTDFVERALPRIEQAINRQISGTFNQKKPALGRGYFLPGVIDGFGYHGDPDFPNRKAICVESRFFIRLINRLTVKIHREIFQRLPFPEFDNKMIKRKVSELLQTYNKLPTPYHCFIQDGSLEDDTYVAYVEQFYNERDICMLKILKEAWEQDKQARAINPEAPLTNLVKIAEYEDVIADKIGDFQQKQQMLRYAKVAAMVFAVFFFVIYLQAILIGKQISDCSKSF